MDSWNFLSHRDALTGSTLYANMDDRIFTVIYTVGALLAYIGIQYYRGAPLSQTFSATITLVLDSLSHVLPYRLQAFGMRAAKRVKMSVDYSTSLVMGAKAQHDDAPCGLGNFDNSCYQNAILQCLAAIPAVREYLYSMSDEFGFTGANSLNGTLATLVETLNDPAHSGTYKWTPRRLKTMDSHNPQDAHEYFSMMLDLGEKEIVQALRERAGHDEKEPFDPNSKALISSDELESSQESVTVVSSPENDIEESSLENDIEEIAHKSGRPKDSRYQNPLDGTLGERTVCDTCGFSEGIRLVDFNCLMTQFPRLLLYNHYCDITQLLEEFTKCETVGPTYCPNCTVLRACDILKETIRRLEESEPQVHESRIQPLRERLAGVEELVESKDFGLDEVNLVRRGIAKKSWVSTTKTKQCVIAKAPRCLAVNIERNVFDETTGSVRKNKTVVKLPSELDLSPWILGGTGLPDGQDPHEAVKECPVASNSPMCRGFYDDNDSADDLNRPQVYRLRALVRHLGSGVDDGHYVCNKLHPVPPQEVKLDDEVEAKVEKMAETDARLEMEVEGYEEKPQEKWWHISDETVRPSHEEFVTQSAYGAFMLFYERVEQGGEPARGDTPVPSEIVEEKTAGLEFREDDTADQTPEMALESWSEQIPATNHTAEAEPGGPDSRIASAGDEGAATDSDADTASSQQSDAESTDEVVRDIPSATPHSPVIMRTAGASSARATADSLNIVQRPSSLSHYS